MATTFYLKRGDRLPSIQATLRDAAGVAVNLSTGVTSVTFRMTKEDGSIVKSGAATAVNAAGGIYRYDWAVGDTDVAGTYNAEFEVLWTTGAKPETYPNSGYLKVNITGDLG